MGMSFKVKAGLLDVGMDKPLGAGPERDEWTVHGHVASQPNLQWEFRRVKSFPLVKLMPGRLNTAEVLVARELEQRSWGVCRYQARFAPSPHAIVLAGWPLRQRIARIITVRIGEASDGWLWPISSYSHDL